MPAPKAILGHLDADTYYISAERVRFPLMLAKRLVGC
jgi:hypothetical protein